MGQKYACSVMVTRRTDHDVSSNHTVCLVEAASRYEAVGKAMRIALKAYPVAENWSGHHVMVCPETNIIDPEGPVSRTDPA